MLTLGSSLCCGVGVHAGGVMLFVCAACDGGRGVGPEINVMVVISCSKKVISCDVSWCCLQ